MDSIEKDFESLLNSLKEIGSSFSADSVPHEITKQMEFLTRNRDEYLKGYKKIPRYLRIKIDNIYTEVTHIKCYKDMLPVGMEYVDWIEILNRAKNSIIKYKSFQ